VADRNRIPQHRRLYELLRRHICENLYPEGSLLPSEHELCAVHEVTRPTVRQALARLASEGFIQKHQGKGSIVKPVPKGIGILSILGTTSGVGRHELKSTALARPEAAAWPADFPFELSPAEREAGCLMLERRRVVDGLPVLYEITFLPNINLPRFARHSFENRSLFDVLRKYYNLEVTGGRQKIRAIGARQPIDYHLGICEGAPVLHLQRKLETNRPGYCFYSSIYCTTEKFYLEGNF
jgi:DNA-binding GntR family transcriptional regulator